MRNERRLSAPPADLAAITHHGDTDSVKREYGRPVQVHIRRCTHGKPRTMFCARCVTRNRKSVLVDKVMYGTDEVTIASTLMFGLTDDQIEAEITRLRSRGWSAGEIKRALEVYVR